MTLHSVQLDYLNQIATQFNSSFIKTEDYKYYFSFNASFYNTKPNLFYFTYNIIFMLYF